MLKGYNGFMSEKLQYFRQVPESIRREAEAPTEVAIKSGDTEARVAPERGGLVTSLMVDGEEILFVDKEALGDPNNKKPRIGIPNLFPYAGSNPPGRMHGGAREVPWVWKDRAESSVEVSLDSASLPDEIKADLRKVYGDDFAYKTNIKMTVRDGVLSYEIGLENKSLTEKSFAPGLHPYFSVPSAERSKITSNVEGFDLSQMDEEHPLVLNMPEGGAWVRLPNGKRITVSASEEFKHIVVWGVDGTDHICVEPFVASGENKAQEFINIGPKQAHNLAVSFKVEDAAVAEEREAQKAEKESEAISEVISRGQAFLLEASEYLNLSDEGIWAQGVAENYREAANVLSRAFSNEIAVVNLAHNLMGRSRGELRTVLTDYIQAIENDDDFNQGLARTQGEAAFLMNRPETGGLGQNYREATRAFLESMTVLVGDLIRRLEEFNQSKKKEGEE